VQATYDKLVAGAKAMKEDSSKSASDDKKADDEEKVR
jgi:hypothetical protein